MAGALVLLGGRVAGAGRVGVGEDLGGARPLLVDLPGGAEGAGFEPVVDRGRGGHRPAVDGAIGVDKPGADDVGVAGADGGVGRRLEAVVDLRRGGPGVGLAVQRRDGGCVGRGGRRAEEVRVEVAVDVGAEEAGVAAVDRHDVGLGADLGGRLAGPVGVEEDRHGPGRAEVLGRRLAVERRGADGDRAGGAGVAGDRRAVGEEVIIDDAGIAVLLDPLDPADGGAAVGVADHEVELRSPGIARGAWRRIGVPEDALRDLGRDVVRGRPGAGRKDAGGRVLAQQVEVEVGLHAVAV